MGSGFVSSTRAPLIDYATNKVQPPAALAVTTNDQLVIKVHNSNAAPSLQVFYRLLLPDGTIVPAQQNIAPDATRAVNTFTFGLDEGFLLSAVVFSATTGVLRGQCYVRLMVWRGSLTQQFVGHLLAEGYVSTATSLGFPIGPQDYAFSGHGVIRSITGTTPAAGAEISETVPTGAIWRLQSFRWTLTNSAAVANREVRSVIDDGVNTLHMVAGNTAQPAGAVWTYEIAPVWLQSGTLLNNFFHTIPWSFYILAGWRIRTNTVALQAGDQYSAPQYTVEEWIQP